MNSHHTDLQSDTQYGRSSGTAAGLSQT